MTADLLDDLRTRADQAGLNLCGVVDTEQFDRSQPPEGRCARIVRDCGTAVVIGSGGAGFWRQLVALRGVPAPATRWRRPLQQYAQASVQPLQARLAASGVEAHHIAPHQRPRLNVARLAEAAGFGVVSPVVGVLLHPRFGPWVCVRAVLLLPGKPFGPIADASLADSFHPCANCIRPCVSACPAGVHDGLGHSDLDRCSDHRRTGGCDHGCNVRRSCPVGAGERLEPLAEQASQREEALALAQRRGFAVWGLLQRLLCR